LWGFNISNIYIFLTIFITDFNNDNCIGKEDLMKTIDRLTQTQLQYQDKQKIIEGVSMKCFCVFSYRRVYGLFYICQYWMHFRWSWCEGSFNALLLSWTQSYNTGQKNLTFCLAHEGKYLILIELLMLNSNM